MFGGLRSPTTLTELLSGAWALVAHLLPTQGTALVPQTW